jgi:dihydropteroate synthase
MESSLTIYPIKKDKLEKVKSLIQELKSNYESSLESLKESGVYIETIFIQNNCLFVYKVAHDIQTMKRLQNQSQLDLYKKIRPVLNECLTSGYNLKPEGEFFNFTP